MPHWVYHLKKLKIAVGVAWQFYALMTGRWNNYQTSRIALNVYGSKLQLKIQFSMLLLYTILLTICIVLMNSYLTHAKKVLSTLSNTKIIIAGDLNKLNIRTLLNQLSLFQMVKTPTRGDNILDVFITNVPNY